jgi:hypothetical protein
VFIRGHFLLTIAVRRAAPRAAPLLHQTRNTSDSVVVINTRQRQGFVRRLRLCVRAACGNQRRREEMRDASSRAGKSFKTKPVVLSLPDGAARCASARRGAQRALRGKSAEGEISCTRQRA